MSIQTITYQDKIYPKFQSEGNAAQFAIPYARHICQGVGYDIGCMKKEWSFPGSIPIDLLIDDPWDALHLPDKDVDYIFSSHCLEHIPDWVRVINYWVDCLKPGGVIFLYLPDYSQKYWRPWNNRKHLNIFTPEIISDYLIEKSFKNIFKSQTDLNNSFMVFGNK